MDEVTALYRELDPLRPLRGDEDALYVDWTEVARGRLAELPPVDS
jgi:hypothetical protein